MKKDQLIVVAGGGGFIGGHLVGDLLARGFTKIRSVDIKPLNEWYQVHEGVENVQADLQEKDACIQACQRIADTTKVTRLLREDGRPDFNVRFYAVDKTGRYGGGAIYNGDMAVFDGKGNRTESLASLFES